MFARPFIGKAETFCSLGKRCLGAVALRQKDRSPIQMEWACEETVK